MISRKINSLFYYLIRYPYFKAVMGEFGYRSRLISPLAVEGHKNIKIGKRVIINYKTWLAASNLTGCSSCILEIGDYSYIGNFNHIYSTNKIIIGKKVLTADKVYISDNLHGYKNVDLPIIDQPIVQLKEVLIGDGAWIGENVCIIGASIGKQSVIGANSVVTKDIPAYCIAVGAPAKIIKRYSFERKEWLKTNSEGNFINS